MTHLSFLSSVRVDSVAQRFRVGSRIGHSHSEMEGSRPAAPALSQDRRADGDVRRLGGLARDERCDKSCWRKLRVLTPHKSEESCLWVFFLGEFFRFFLVTAVTSAGGTFHSFFLGGDSWQGAGIWQLVPSSLSCAVSWHTVRSHLCLVLLACCLCLVDRALPESGNCSDVWNVRYSSAHYTIESRRGTRISIRLISFRVAQFCWVMSRFAWNSSFTGHRCEHSAVAWARVGGIAHRILFIVEHDFNSQFFLCFLG